MDLATAERQGVNFVTDAGCQAAADTLECMYSLNSSAAIGDTPAAWDPQFVGFHDNPQFVG